MSTNLGVMVILFHEKLVGSKIRFENYGHSNSDCGFGAGDDGSGFTQLKGCIRNMFRILMADEVECCTSEKEVSVEDAHLFLTLYDLFNDDDIGEKTISATLQVDGGYKQRAPRYVASNIRYFNVHFLDQVLFLMGCNHPPPFYEPVKKTVYASLYPEPLTRENFTSCALQTIGTTLIPAFQLLRTKSFYMDDVYEYVDLDENSSK